MACKLRNHIKRLASDEKEVIEICKIKEVNAKGYLISDSTPTYFFRIKKWPGVLFINLPPIQLTTSLKKRTELQPPETFATSLTWIIITTHNKRIKLCFDFVIKSLTSRSRSHRRRMALCNITLELTFYNTINTCRDRDSHCRSNT